MLEQLKILHILDHSLPHQDGYSNRSCQIMAAQRRKGWGPFVLTSPKHERECGDRGPIKEVIDGTDYHRCGWVRPKKRGLDEIFIMIRLFLMLWDRIRRQRPHIIHAHSPILNVVPAFILAKLFKIPVVYEIRAFWEDAGVDQGTYTIGSLKYRLVRFIETCCCRIADHVFVICNGLKKDLAARGVSDDKITIIYNAIHPEDFKNAQPDEELRARWNLEGKKVIGFIGSFYRYEGLDLLIRAFSKVRAVHQDAVLLLVGAGEVESELKKLTQSIEPTSTTPSFPVSEPPGLRASQLPSPSLPIIFTGRIPNQEVPQVYALMDLLVYPRYSVRLTELVTPLKPLEAMAMGKPIVASDIGGHRELIKDGINGRLFVAGDIDALAQAIADLLENESQANELAENGKRHVNQHFKWSATTVPYEVNYRRLLKRNMNNSPIRRLAAQ